jgi:membrane associated rhomboid family serine protease
MSDDRLQPYTEEPRLTPWVGRVMAANAAVLLLLQTVFTAPAFVEALQFVPGSAGRHPWTIISYMFAHGGLLHLAGNMVMLFIFGPPVERRMGGRAFVAYYLYCGVGAAALALGLSSMMPIDPFIGASGAVLGVALAFAFAWPDAELVVFPLPLRITARTLVLLLALVDLTAALWVTDGIAHVAHLGGMVAGYAFFRIQSLASSRGSQKEPKTVVRRPVMAPIQVRQGSPAADVRPAPVRSEPREEVSTEEIDRVLDKISAFGLASLTLDERRFLDEASQRKRTGLH